MERNDTNEIITVNAERIDLKTLPIEKVVKAIDGLKQIKEAREAMGLKPFAGWETFPEGPFIRTLTWWTIRNAD